MDFYRKLLELKDEEVKNIVEETIKQKEEESDSCNEDNNTIGYVLQHNPELEVIINNEEEDDFGVDIICFHPGYVKFGTKVVYGMVYDFRGISSNDGKYYYIDDESYIYDFCNYIRQYDVIDEYELMDYMLEFIRQYFGYFNKNTDREEMFKLLKNSHNKNIEPVKEHGLSWFKDNGNALCSEYSIVAQNLLNVFGIDSYLVIGREKTGDEKGESHAFNIVDFVEDESKEEVHALVDFANFVTIYDLDFNECGESPFIGLLEDFSDEFVDQLINDEKHMTFEDYSYVIVNDRLVHLVYDRKRDYYIANGLIPDSFTVKRKKSSKK